MFCNIALSIQITMPKAKKFQVRISYHVPINSAYVVKEDIETILTGDLYRLISRFNKTKDIASITIVKIKS